MLRARHIEMSIFLSDIEPLDHSAQTQKTMLMCTVVGVDVTIVRARHP